LHAQFKAEGYTGGYTRLTDFIRDWRHAEGKTFSTNAFVPLTFGLGEAFQFDWSEEPLVVGGIYRRMQVSHLKLCASRAFWLVAYPSQGHEMLFDAHTRSFTALGGVPQRGIYDNMKTAVDKVKKGKGFCQLTVETRTKTRQGSGRANNRTGVADQITGCRPTISRHCVKRRRMISR
jgi:transposase